MVLVVTKEHQIRAALAGACKKPRLNARADSFSSEDLEWAATNMLTKDEKAELSGNVPASLVGHSGYGYGDGYVYGSGDGSGYGDGYGYGSGDGSGYGSGDGYGSGYGSGYGYGSGSGDGYGYGDGYGSGDGSGYGDGYGYGSGDGSGYGSGKEIEL